MDRLTWVTKACGVFFLWAATAAALPAQTFTSLYSFDGTDGANPYVGLVQAAGGNLYGTTSFGGATDCLADNGCGTIFKITPSGMLTTLYIFCSGENESCPYGGFPSEGLIQATDGNFYGTANGGGANTCSPFGGCGTVFRMTPGLTLTALHSFDGTDGDLPDAGLAQGADGNFYGTTAFGGANTNKDCANGCGTVFTVTPSGQLTTLHSFDGTDGAGPVASLALGTDGNFYGTTSTGGHVNSKHCSQSDFGYTCGTVFKITPGGVLTTLHKFCSQTDCTDGFYPYYGLVQGNDGNFYGTTWGGGAKGCGTVFKMTPSGVLTTLYSFAGYPTDGALPAASLALGTDGNFYGETSTGGANNYGTLFEITPSGTLTTLYDFDGTDGSYAEGGLVQDTNGTFYGTTANGGANSNCDDGYGCGTVFSLSVGLGLFVKTNPVAGKVAAKVGILGTDLTGATAVTFNGIAAEFKVVSPTLIATKVPSGATTGPVQVQLHNGTLSSNVSFIVLR